MFVSRGTLLIFVDRNSKELKVDSSYGQKILYIGGLIYMGEQTRKGKTAWPSHPFQTAKQRFSGIIFTSFTDSCPFMKKKKKVWSRTCAQASKFGSSMSCKQSKFQQKIHSKWQIWMLDFEQKVSTDGEDSQVCLSYYIVYH